MKKRILSTTPDPRSSPRRKFLADLAALSGGAAATGARSGLGADEVARRPARCGCGASPGLTPASRSTR